MPRKALPLNVLKKQLKRYKLTKAQKEAERPYDIGRTTICHLVYTNPEYLDNNGKFHIFEVRAYSFTKDSISLSVVNWTLAAGTARLEIDANNVHHFSVFEETPALQVLTGPSDGS
jgi:hypothetical protein